MINRKNVKKTTSRGGGKTKIKTRRDGSIKKEKMTAPSGKVIAKVKYNRDGSIKRASLPKMTADDFKPKKKKKMYREGGANNASYSYQDFLDL
tara:strand:- start:415 stop:693 length:279 start_codon:yes stop_codon:yes gene_type:complete